MNNTINSFMNNQLYIQRQAKIKRSIQFIIINLAALFVVIVVILPYLWMVSCSFKTTFEIQSSDSQIEGQEPKWIPRNPVLTNYKEINTTVPMLKYLKNSLIMSTGSMLLAILLSLFASYGLSRIRFHWKKTYEMVLFSTQMFPGVAFLIPYFVIFILITKFTGIPMKNTYHGMIITYTTFSLPFTILMLRNYLSSIPVEIDEQAQIDGCNKLQILFLIILPLSLPGLASIGIFAFIMGWNEMLFASVLTGTDTRPVSLGLMDYITVNGANWGGMMAACIVVTIPVLILFILLQKQVVGNLTEGSTKG